MQNVQKIGILPEKIRNAWRPAKVITWRYIHTTIKEATLQRHAAYFIPQFKPQRFPQYFPQ